jgi:hypothetical protein
MEQLLTVLMLAAVVAVIGAPLRRGRRAAAIERSGVAAAEAATDAKYREILEAELDYRTGKLEAADHSEIDRALRAEAVELTRRLDAERARE